jgi:hypothetical protein
MLTARIGTYIVRFDNHLIRRLWWDSKFRLTEIIQKVRCSGPSLVFLN